MNNIEELKKAALAVLELTDVKGCWQSSLLETKDRGAVHAIVTEHGDNICEATGDTVIDSVIIDYIESASPAAMLDLIAQLEAAQKESAIRLEAIEQMRKTVAHNVDRAQKAEAALSAANEKLNKPVVLPPRRSASSFVDEEFSNKDLAAIYNAARVEFSVKITNAGFTVEGG